ncbi:u6 small nuclear RNA-methyltransferase [Trichonephila clavipes]|nr:u6 small nuclear RNA-methyltransferase [Trichonephila clavipes]
MTKQATIRYLYHSATAATIIFLEKQSCFDYLTSKHTARSCKTHLRVVICGKRHVPLMCESLKTKNQDSYRSEKKGPKVEVNMANNTSSLRVFLQTLKLKMVCGNKEIPVRAILDWVTKVSCIDMANNTSSLRVFLQTLKLKMVCGNKEIPVRAILDWVTKVLCIKNVVEKMGCIPLRKEILVHSLFGGFKSDKREHTCYRIRLRNQDNSVTCNLEALDQTSICDNIASVTPGSWISELNEMKIQLSDVGEESRSVYLEFYPVGLLPWRQYLD